MKIFSRYGYNPGLLRQLKLKIPDGGKPMPANLSLNSPVHGILEQNAQQKRISKLCSLVGI